MRIVIGVGMVLALAGCGGAIDSAEWSADAAGTAVAPAPRPIVGTLRMRDRDLVLTADTLDARGNEALREMTAQSVTPVMADIDAHYVRTSGGEELGPIQAGLDF